jgi:Mrp family chromosome partitioning ATPase
MNRNYEALQQVGKGQELSPPPLQEQDSVARPTNIERNGWVLEGLEKEEVTKLVQRVFLQPGPEVSRAVVFSSSENGAGCSWITARVAKVLSALVPGSVCVVDANLRSPDLQKQFGAANHRGLADALQHPGPIRDFTQQLGVNLWLMSADSGKSNGHTTLIPDRICARMAELRKEFDYVVIDSPPLNLYGDATVVARGCDGVVLILKANVSRRETVRKVLQDLSAANVRVLGTVLNQRTFPLPQAIYSKL